MKERQYDSLIIYITTKCNRKCNGCFVNVEKNYEISQEEIDFIKQHIGKVNQLVVTGGEPTMHKKFKEIVLSLMEIENSYFILATNGYGLTENISVLNAFDEIRISEYAEDSNAEQIADFLKNHQPQLKPRIVVQKINMKTEVTNTGSCGREHNGIAAYYKRRIYGCCVSAGIKGSESCDYNSDWRINAANLSLPCKKCIF